MYGARISERAHCIIFVSRRLHPFVRGFGISEVSSVLFHPLFSAMKIQSDLGFTVDGSNPNGVPSLLRLCVSFDGNRIHFVYHITLFVFLPIKVCI